MQIQKIQSNNTSFGYNQTLNQKVVKSLAGKRKQVPFFKDLIELNSFTNKVENQLRVAEDAGQETLANNLMGLFIDLKTSLATAIEWNLPNLKYSDIESRTYEEEAKGLGVKDPSHWLWSVSDELKDVISDVNEQKEEISKEADAIVENIPKDDENVLSGFITFSELPDGMGERLQKFIQESDENVTFDDFPKDIQQAIISKIAEMHGIELNEEAPKLEITDPKVKQLVSVYEPTETAKAGFAALGGMTELKKTLNDRVVNMLKNPEQARIDAEEYGKKMPNGLLLYGPPGCGKTTVVEHLSTEAGVPLLKLETGKLKTAYYHETSRNIDTVFDFAESVATPERPIIIMVDDADSFFMARNDRTTQFEGEEMTTFLNRIQRAGDHNIVVAATTNRYDMMDEAIRSRFEEQIYVGLPDKDARKSVIKLFMDKRTKGQKLASDDKALELIASKTEGFPIRAIKMMSDKASLEALNDGRRDITADDFEKIISQNLDMKVKENNYKTNNTRVPIGFNNSTNNTQSK